MNKKTPLTERLAALSALRDRPLSEETRRMVLLALDDKNNLTVAAGAKIAKKLVLRDALPHLRTAFDRFMRDPAKTDKLCHAKLALVDALDELEFPDGDLFLTATRHVQHEPAYGGSVDTAVKLRVRGGQALARMGHRDLFFVLTGLLADPEPEVRFSAARILSGLNDERSELLLQLRVLAGDAKPENYGEYFSALLSLNAQRSLHLVAGYLGNPEPVIAEEAAIALGESRAPEAFGLLTDLYASTFAAERRRVLIVAISLLRSEPAADFLVRIVAGESIEPAITAIDSLRLYRDQERTIAQLTEVVANRKNARLSEKMKEMIDGSGGNKK